MPAAIDLEVWVAVEPWDRPSVELTSLDLGETRSFEFDELGLAARDAHSWIDYVAGTAWAMREAGLTLRGFRGVLDSTVPVGSGLSSSAALESLDTHVALDIRLSATASVTRRSSGLESAAL